MAVISKFLDNAITKYEKLGYSKLKLSQGIVGTCICAYVLQVTYPLIKHQYDCYKGIGAKDDAAHNQHTYYDKTDNNNSTKNFQNNERIGGDDEDDRSSNSSSSSSSSSGNDGQTDQVLDVKKQIAKAEKLLAKTKRKPTNIGLNKEFVMQLKQLILIMIPNLVCREIGLLSVHTLCLISRTFLSIYVASMEGAIVKYIVRKDIKNFLIMLMKWFGIAIPATFINSMIRYLECKLALAFR